MKKEAIFDNTEVKETEAVEGVETFETVETITEPVKPYIFRKLGSDDVFLMFRIISKIGINEFTSCFGKGSVIETIKRMSKDEKESNTGTILAFTSVALEAANIILGNIEKCRDDIYRMLANTSNMTVEDIRAEGNAVMFLEMLVDFLKKEEFGDFIKVVSKLFK